MKKGFLRMLALRLDSGSDDERYLNLHVRVIRRSTRAAISAMI